MGPEQAHSLYICWAIIHLQKIKLALYIRQHIFILGQAGPAEQTNLLLHIRSFMSVVHQWKVPVEERDRLS